MFALSLSLGLVACAVALVGLALQPCILQLHSASTDPASPQAENVLEHMFPRRGADKPAGASAGDAPPGAGSSSASADAKAPDPYALLGLERGTADCPLTPEEVNRAYRRASLTCHPDKRAGP